MIDRGEKLEVLADKSDTLKTNAIKFKSEAKALKRKMCCQNYKFILIVILVLLVSLSFILDQNSKFYKALAFVITTWACGGFTYEKCRI